MKKLVFLLTGTLIFLLTACLEDNDDHYSLNNFWIGFGVITGQTGDYEIVLDNHDLLIPIASEYGNWQNHFKAGDRVWMNYTILGDKTDSLNNRTIYYAKINQIEKVLKKDIITMQPEMEDSIGNDPIIVDDAWIADSLITFQLRYKGYNRTHLLNLVLPDDSPLSDASPIELELRHNAHEDAEEILYQAFVSFSLNRLQISGSDSVQVHIVWNNYEGTNHTLDRVFHYGHLN